MSFVEQDDQRRGISADPLRKQVEMVFAGRSALRRHTDRCDLNAGEPAAVNPGAPLEFANQPLLAPEGACAEALGA